ncbi:MAG: tetratricopeptide repeat protein [Bacteroidota bacterium]
MKIRVYILILLGIVNSLALSQTNLSNKYRLAKTYEQNGELQKAKSIYEELVTAKPNNNQYSNSLNEVYIKLKEYDNSVEFLTKRISNNPKDVSLYGMLGSTYYLMGNREKASEYWGKGIDVNKNSTINYSIISNYAIQNRAFENAIKYLEQGKTTAKNPTQFSYQLAQVYSVSMNYSKAAEEYCLVLLRQSKQLDYVKRRMQSYLASPGALEQSIDVTKKYQDNFTVQELLVFLYIQNDQFNDAYDLIVDIDTEQNRNGVLVFNFANEAYRNKKYSSASEAFKYVINNYPSSPFAINSQIGYAKTLESELDNNLNSDQNWKPIKSIDTTGAGKYIPVLKTYDDILRKINNIEAVNEVLYRMGSIKLYHFNDLDGASEKFMNIINNSSLSQFYGLGNLKLADISIVKGDLEKAKNYLMNSFSSIKTQKESKSEAKYKLALIHFWNSEFDRSLNTLNDINKDLSNNVSNDAIQLSMIINMGRRDSINLVKFAKADLLTTQKSFSDAAKLFNDLSEEDGFFLLNNISQFKYAEILIAQNNYPIAIEILKELSEKEKLNIFTDQSLFLLAQVYENGISDKKSAITIYEEILKYHPNSLYLEKAREGINRLKTKEVVR